jgi:hypothetical protein
MDVNALINQAREATTKLEDQTKVQSGGDFEYEAPAAGPTPARFVGYVELGKRKQRAYQGKEKPDAEEVMLFFELNGKKHVREVEIEGEKKTFTNLLRVRVTKKLNEKAGFTKLFNKMLYGRDGITHMAQMLGEGFLVTVIQNEVEKDGKKRVYANLKDKDGNWQIAAPMYQTDPLDPDTLQPLPVPEATIPVKLLLWGGPTKEQWESIFVDGTRTVKDAKGNETEVSKNWLQEDIVQNAVDFEGSPLQAMLGGLADLTLEEEPQDSPEVAEEAGAPETPEEAAEKQPAPAADPLAALGL